MSKEIKLMKIAGSNFDRNERFGLQNVPKHFESVTDDEIERLKNLVLNETQNISQYKPGALLDILKSVDGHFDSAYSTLEGDYGTRLANLNEVYTRGISQLRHACGAFELQVAEYNIAFENYLEATKNLGNRTLPRNLMIDVEAINRIKQSVKDLDGRSSKDE